MDAVRKWEEEQRTITPRVQDKQIELLQGYLDQVPQLKQDSERQKSGAFTEWKTSVCSVLRRTFGENSAELTSFKSVRYESAGAVVGRGRGSNEHQQEFAQGMERAAGVLRSIITMLDQLGIPPAKPLVEKHGNQFIINQTANPTMRQEQTQSVTVTFEQVREALVDKLNEEQAAELMPLIQEWQEKPTAWSKAQKVASKALEFGENAFMTVLPLMAQAFLKSKGINF